MKCVTWCFLLPTLALAVVLGYYLNMVVPPEVERPWVARTYLGLMNLADDLSHPVGKLASIHPVTVKRKIADTLRGVVQMGHLDGVSTSLETIAGVPVMVHQPEANAKNRKAILFMHGGDFSTGTVEGSADFCNQLAKKGNAVVFNIGYSLAPEAPSPAALTDCHKVAQVVTKTAAKWKIDPKKVVVAGEGSGAALAAALALKLRDAAGPSPVAGQVLLHPVLQAINFHTPSRLQPAPFARKPKQLAESALLYVSGKADHVDHLLSNAHLSTPAMKKLAMFVDRSRLPPKMLSDEATPPETAQPDTPLPKAIEKALANPLNFPLMAANVSGLPATYVLTLEGDAVRDDGLFYAQRLRAAGVPVTHAHESRGFHGMLHLFRDQLRGNATTETIQKVALFLKKH